MPVLGNEMKKGLKVRVEGFDATGAYIKGDAVVVRKPLKTDTHVKIRMVATDEEHLIDQDCVYWRKQ
ncbi:MAG: hypothetical protein K5891_11615 [Lachnospiraceae bacterium]|nr:hypothetical protein [Lachnospiraceae bacterium]